MELIMKSFAITDINDHLVDFDIFDYADDDMADAVAGLFNKTIACSAIDDDHAQWVDEEGSSAGSIEELLSASDCELVKQCLIDNEGV
jgi:hypothetical protein